MKKIIFALIAGTAAMAAQAQVVGSPYVGAGVSVIDHDAKVPGASNLDSDGRTANGKIFAGWDFDKTWAAEIGYTDFRSADFNYNIGNTRNSGSTDGNSYYVAGKATHHFNDQFGLFGKLGVARTKINLNSTTFNYNDTKTEGYGAIGVEYNINKQVALSLEYERFGNSKDFGAQANVFTVAAKYNF
jgi:Outer membrane protein beta-barrel domain